MNKIIVSAVAVVSSAPMMVTAPAWAQAPATPETYAYGRQMMGWGGSWDGMFFGPLFMVLVIAAVIGLTFLLVRRPVGSWNGASPGPQGRTALDILKERFARGEIDKADYEERRRVLGE